MHSHGGHNHEQRENRNKGVKLASMMCLTFIFFLAELIVGYVCKSMVLLTDSFHMFSDLAALALAYVCAHLSSKQWSRSTFGWIRAEILGALVNSVFLIALCFSLLFEAISRFFDPKPIEKPVLVLLVGTVGLLFNLIGLFIFGDCCCCKKKKKRNSFLHQKTRYSQIVDAVTSMQSDPSIQPVDETLSEDHQVGSEQESRGCCSSCCCSRATGHAKQHGGKKNQGKIKVNVPKPGPSSDEMNTRGVFLHILGDFTGSLVVIISALVVWLGDWKHEDYIDPALTTFQVTITALSTWGLFKESALILMQTAPTHLQVRELEKRLLEEVEHVVAVHDFHVWQLTGDNIIATAHIHCHNILEYKETARKIKCFFHKCGIHSTTIQPEFLPLNDQSDSSSLSLSQCQLKCDSQFEMTTYSRHK